MGMNVTCLPSPLSLFILSLGVVCAARGPTTPSSSPALWVHNQLNAPMRVGDSAYLEGGDVVYSDGGVRYQPRPSAGMRFWSTDPTVVSIDSAGRTIALRPGKATVVAMWPGGQGSRLVTIAPRELALRWQPSRMSCRVGEVVVLRPEALDTLGHPVQAAILVPEDGVDPPGAAVQFDRARPWRNKGYRLRCVKPGGRKLRAVIGPYEAWAWIEVKPEPS